MSSSAASNSARRLASASKLAVMAMLAAPIALASPGDRPLHVRTPGLSDGELVGVIRDAAGEPRGILSGGEMVSMPEPGGHTPDTQTVGASRTPSFRPDTATSMRTELGYYATFAPSIAPHKRLTALDAVAMGPGGEPELVLSETATVPLLVAERPESAGRARFVGEITLDFSRGERVPFPSVSPRMRILHVRSDPPVELRFERDGAYNFYATVDEVPPRPVHVAFLVDAEESHFNQPVPRAPTDALAHRAPRLPPALEARALELAEEIGASRDRPLAVSLEALVEYFRSFVESDRPPEGEGSLYEVLTRGGLGICRHRAYAFTITALALGIPTRFVYNEAHAWVEVDLPERGSLRVDLGGSTTTVRGHGFEGRPLYEPPLGDPFPQPESYLESMRRMGRPVRAGASRAAAASDERAGTLRVVVESSELAGYRGVPSELELRVLDEEGLPVASLPVEVRASSDPPRPLGAAITDEEGRAVVRFAVPLDLPPGSHSLSVVTPGRGDVPPQRLAF